MLKGLRVPTHRIDVPGLFVFTWDDAWDKERIAAEREELAAMAHARMCSEARATMAAQLGRDLTPEELVEADESCVLTEDERDEAMDRHPVSRFLAGDTRFDPRAVDQGPRGQACAFDYLREGATPTVFTLRRVGYQARMRIEALGMRDAAASHAAWCKAGVESIACGSDVLWQATPGERELPESWMETIAETDGGALFSIIALAAACKAYSRPLDDSEKKPSARGV